MDPKRRKNRLVLFITDRGFLVPTMSAALQVHGQAAVTEIADILILAIDFEPAELDALSDAFAHTGIRFVPVPSSLYALPEGVHFNATGVPPSTLARLSIGDLLPEQYEHVTYLDGDIQIVGDIAPLVRHDTAPGHIAAGNEAIWLSAGTLTAYWRNNRDYLAELGISDPATYFNAGVLLFRRSTWLEAAPLAKAFFLENSRRCKFHDQSALNHVFKGRREFLSPAWNLTSDVADLRLDEEIDPRILHFTGPRKPWFYSGAPWMGRYVSGYEDLVRRYPVLAPYVRRPSADKLARLHAAYERRGLAHRALIALQSTLRRRRLRRFLSKTRFAVS